MTTHKQYRKLYRISTTLAFIITEIIILHDIISLDSEQNLIFGVLILSCTYPSPDPFSSDRVISAVSPWRDFFRENERGKKHPQNGNCEAHTNVGHSLIWSKIP